jgi:hypothetical protein
METLTELRFKAETLLELSEREYYRKRFVLTQFRMDSLQWA